MRIKPVYGGRRVEVRPRRWWHPNDRKAARLAAAVLEYELEHAQPGQAIFYPGSIRPSWRAVPDDISSNEDHS